MPYHKLTTKEKAVKGPKPLAKPLWDLYRDGLTQGAIEVFLTCREQFRLKYEQGWTSKEGSSELEFGSAFHHVLALAHSQKVAPKYAVGDYIKTQKKGANLTSKERESLDLILAQVQVVAESYLKFWGKEDQGKKWVAREEVFKYLHPALHDTGKRDDLIRLRGRWDGLYSDKSKHLRLHETKTKGNIDQDGIRLTLPIDLQTMLYGFTAERHFQQRIYGTTYDVVRRPQLRNKEGESLKDFVGRIQKDIAERPRWYFMRWEVDLKASDLERFHEAQLVPILKQVSDWFHDRQANHFINSKALFTRFGSRCDMFGPITQQNYFGLYRRKVCYPELVD